VSKPNISYIKNYITSEYTDAMQFSLSEHIVSYRYDLSSVHLHDSGFYIESDQMIDSLIILLGMHQFKYNNRMIERVDNRWTKEHEYALYESLIDSFPPEIIYEIKKKLTSDNYVYWVSFGTHYDQMVRILNTDKNKSNHIYREQFNTVYDDPSNDYHDDEPLQTIDVLTNVRWSGKIHTIFNNHLRTSDGMVGLLLSW
jgi:hypothetical protein